ncbi:MAG: stress response translation initiation inhibitor YciH [Candidatus Woesearchaeota archaeon]
MSDIDPITGLPKELGVWETITKENQKITAKVISKKFGKKYTVIQGIDKKDIDLKEVAKKLKNILACGGTVKEGFIELQGDHLHKIKPELIKLGFAPDTIDIR